MSCLSRCSPVGSFRWRSALPSVVAAMVLAACGTSGSGANSSSAKAKPTSSLATPSTKATTTTNAAESIATFQAKWCSLSVGDPTSKANEVLGDPDSPDTASAGLDYLRSSGFEVPAGTTFDGWSSGSGRYLVTYENGAVTQLQAYEGTIGPAGAVGLPCNPFRN